MASSHPWHPPHLQPRRAVLRDGSPTGSTVFAATAFLTVGPIVLPIAVPVSACINSICVSTPSETNSITLTAPVTDTVGVAVLTPGTCPLGEVGAVINISTGGSATISGTVSGTADGMPFSELLGPVTVAGPSATVSAWATP